MANGNQVTLHHGGAYEITLSRSGERGLVVEVFDMEEDASSVAPMTPAEWDAFVAAGNAALGRPVREQGATVPRAGVAAALAPVLTLHAQIAEECGRERTNAIELLLTALDEARATLEAAGLWPVAAPGGEPAK